MTKNASPLADAALLYGRVLYRLLVGVGVLVLMCAMTGWFFLVFPSPGQEWAEVESSKQIGSSGPAVIAGPTLKVVGQKALFSKDAMLVDTAKTYRLDADVRVLPKKDGSPQKSLVYFGVSTYDSAGNELKSRPGRYRYAGASGKTISSDQGWVHLSGTITGEGNENHTQFRPGTRSVKIVMLANFQGEKDAVMLIRSVIFTEPFSLEPGSG